MKNLIAKLIVELIRGTNIKLKTMNFSLNNKDQEILRQSLQKELEKPSIEQSKTPTQLVNEYLYKKFKQDFNFTPSCFGEKAHKLIIQWGVNKAKDFNEQ
tara:strand:+ start:282 stop:581 length:300 start_codon:yes stop_codon:yes gene_type:complete